MIELEQAILTIAFLSVKRQNPDITNDREIDRLVDIESARIERCIEYQFKVDKECDLHFDEFAAKFLLDNSSDIISGEEFTGLYLDDVDDVDFSYE